MLLTNNVNFPSQNPDYFVLAEIKPQSCNEMLHLHKYNTKMSFVDNMYSVMSTLEKCHPVDISNIYDVILKNIIFTFN